jgi:hypothetical protein
VIPFLAFLVAAQAGPLDTVTSTTVKVDVSKVLATMPPQALGIGVAVWDEHMMDSDAARRVREAGFKVIRYPGGSYADLYQWKTHSSTKGMEANIQKGREFDSFMGLCRRTGTTPLITVNYGSNPEGTGGAEPGYAAEWVRYANKEKGYGVKYWEIGNEVYGNGFYNGTGWEVDLHAPDTKQPKDRLKNPKLGPLAYGENVNAFVTAMKAEDSTVKIGAVLTTPGGWPDGVEPDWNTTVLNTCGRNVDFVVVHWYGDGKSPAEVLTSLRNVPKIMTKLKELVATYCRPGTEIWMTEGDSSSQVMRHPGALFAADHFMTWLENGASHVDWWNLHNGLSHWQGIYDDQGILSSGHSTQGVTQPPANTPFPPYYGVQMFSRAASPGDRFLAVTSSRPTLVAHAVRRKNGKVAVMLINEDPDHDSTVTVQGVAGFSERLEYRRGMSGIRRSRGKTDGAIRVPAYSIVVLQ